jgi:5-oxoprolinase (ATP-hydrolysing) subunit A
MKSAITIDINCDLGEGCTPADGDNDALLMPYLSSCNIACGGHAGNLETIDYAINNALQHQLKIGAHPGYPDQDNFGRSSLGLSTNKTVESLRQQFDLFLGVVNKNNATLNHIKLHGSLYNDVEQNIELADAIADYLIEMFPDINVYGLAQGHFQKVCENKNLNFIPEGFMDRRYQTDGTLMPRTETGAVITQDNQCIQQAIALAKNQPIVSSTGALISPTVKTICLHGDNENALTIARDLYQELANNDISVG